MRTLKWLFVVWCAVAICLIACGDPWPLPPGRQLLTFFGVLMILKANAFLIGFYVGRDMQ